MGKSERQQAVKMANDNANRAINNQGENAARFEGELETQTTKANDTYDATKSAYEGMMGGTGAYDPDTYNKISGQNEQNIDTGGYNKEDLARVQGDIGENVKSGGYNQGDLDKLNENYSQLTLGGLGGVNAESATKLRGGYTNLIDTGGLSEDTAGAMRRQAAGSAQSIYSNLGRNLTRTQASSGFGGAGGETAQLARQSGQAAATATTDANSRIGQIRQTGTIAGLGGLSQFEQGVAGGQRSAVAGQSQLAGDQARNRVTSVGQEADVAGQRARGTLQASQANQDLATGAAQQKIQAAGGMVNLYNSDPGYVKTLIQGILQSQQTTGSLTSQQAQIMAEVSKQPGLLQTIIGDVAALGGAAAGVLTGVGGLSGGGK